jgi:hypothetical protein
VNPVYWQVAVVMAATALGILCGREAARKPEDRRHQRGDGVRAGRSVISIRNRVVRECAEYRLTRALTLYLVTHGTLKPDTQTEPLPIPQSATTSSPLNLPFQSPDIELMQRVLNGLRRLPEQGVAERHARPRRAEQDQK